MTSLVGRVLFDGKEVFVSPDKKNDESLLVLRGDYESGFIETNEKISIKDVKFELPFVPGKLFGIGKNYPSDEAANVNINFFIMANNALLPHLSPLNLSRRIGSLIPEGELAVVISKTLKDVSVKEAEQAILGYTICNDFSARETDPSDVPVAIKKSSDGLLPMGPYLLIENKLRDFYIKTYKNNELLQSGSTTGMINTIPELISYISSFITLNRFDLISTGTPGPKMLAYRGDTIRVEINEIGVLENSIF